jgi:uncharacterized membrane protein
MPPDRPGWITVLWNNRTRMSTMQPDMTRRLRWLGLVMVPLIAQAIAVHSALITPLVGIVLTIGAAACVFKARR